MVAQQRTSGNANTEEIDDDRIGGRRGPSEPSAAQRIVGTVETDGTAIWRAGDGAIYATIEEGGRRAHLPLLGRELGEILAARHLRQFGKVARRGEIADAQTTLAGQARLGGARFDIHTRLGASGGAIYLDLADDAGQVVEIDAVDWRIVAERDCPVRFLRPEGQQPLPVPVRGGDLAELRRFLNVDAPGGDADRFALLVAWLVGAFQPRGPYAILQLDGLRGSGKSTACRILRALIDPHAASTRNGPTDERSLVAAAKHGHVVSMDNSSGVSPEMADALCRLATGGGFATRKLYTDDEETFFGGARPMLINGINLVTSRGDLLDRMIALTLPALPGGHRTEQEIEAAFAPARPRILGALLDAVSGALRELPATRVAHLPRMADFGRWVIAAERAGALPWAEGDFLRAYEANRAELRQGALEANPVGQATIAFLAWLDRQPPVGSGWVRGGDGSVTQDAEEVARLDAERHEGAQIGALWVGPFERFRRTLENLPGTLDALDKHWPQHTRGMITALRRVAPDLREQGIALDFDVSRQQKTGLTRFAIRRLPTPGAEGRPDGGAGAGDGSN